MRVLYHGVWNKTPGHFLFEPDGRTISMYAPIAPGLSNLDGYFAGDLTKVTRWGDGIFGKRTIPHWDTKDEEQGAARLHFVDGWTVLSFWDRSGDSRGGCSSTFLAEGRHSFQQMVELAREHFPHIWQRITDAFTVRLVADMTPGKS